jgi:hypothetical protein
LEVIQKPEYSSYFFWKRLEIIEKIPEGGLIMWLLFGPVIVLSFIYGAIWLRNRWVLDTFNSYGVYGNMAGLYVYKKFGLWHIGNKQVDEKAMPETLTRKHKLEVKEAYPKPA